MRFVVTSTWPSDGRGSPCPVAWTPTGRFSAAAYRTAAATSPAEVAATTRAGHWPNPVWNPASSSS
jgi:hypothetical protein